jgi:hypothetical protein
MAYDSARGVDVIFSENGTWEYDGANWTPFSPATVPYELWSVLFYDTATSQTILFGAGDSSSFPGNNTYVWSGGNWNQLSPAGSPPMTFGAASAFDVARGEAIIYGGSDGYNVYNTAWTWTGTTWNSQTIGPAQTGLSCTDACTVNNGGCGDASVTCSHDPSTNAVVCGCNAGANLCGSSCVDLTSDPNNCGNCGKVCPSGDLCGDGACAP